MALQTINLGTYANDGTGDDLRTAFQKVNANLIELYSTVSGCNVGSVPPTSGVNEGELWWSTVDGKLYIYYGSSWIEASPAGLSVTYDISATATTGGSNLDLSGSNGLLSSVKFASGTNITVTRTSSNTITLSSTSYTGDVTGTVSSLSNHTLSSLSNVSPTAPTQGQVLIYDSGLWRPGNVSGGGGPGDLDFGSFVTPSSTNLDLGSF